MGCSDANAVVLGGDAFEHTLHLFESQALMRFVVEPGHLVSVGVVANDSMEDADATGSGVLNRFADLIE